MDVFKMNVRDRWVGGGGQFRRVVPLALFCLVNPWPNFALKNFRPSGWGGVGIAWERSNLSQAFSQSFGQITWITPEKLLCLRPLHPSHTPDFRANSQSSWCFFWDFRKFWCVYFFGFSNTTIWIAEPSMQTTAGTTWWVSSFPHIFNLLNFEGFFLSFNHNPWKLSWVSILVCPDTAGWLIPSAWSSMHLCSLDAGCTFGNPLYFRVGPACSGPYDMVFNWHAWGPCSSWGWNGKKEVNTTSVWKKILSIESQPKFKH